MVYDRFFAKPDQIRARWAFHSKTLSLDLSETIQTDVSDPIKMCNSCCSRLASIGELVEAVSETIASTKGGT